jgi:hypothetical protein
MTRKYEIIDIQTGAKFGPYKTLRQAHTIADKKDLQYGAVRYVVRPVKGECVGACEQSSLTGTLCTLGNCARTK